MPKLPVSPKVAADLLGSAVRREALGVMRLMLFEDKYDPNLMHDGKTMLHIAAEMGHDKAISMLLEAGADVHKLSSEHKSILRSAIKIGDEVSVKKLLEAGADPTAGGFEQELNRHLTDADLSRRYVNEVSWPVMQAVRKYHVNQAARHRDASMLEALLMEGQPPDTFDRYGKTALATAVETGWPEGVEILLRYKANPNLVQKDGSTPMHYAASGKSAEVVEMLYGAGAQMRVWDSKNRKPLELGEENAHMGVKNAVRKCAIEAQRSFNAQASRLSEDIAAPPRAVFRKKTPQP